MNAVISEVDSFQDTCASAELLITAEHSESESRVDESLAMNAKMGQSAEVLYLRGLGKGFSALTDGSLKW